MQPSQLNPREDHEKDNSALNKVIVRNIRTIIHLRTIDAKERSPQNQIAEETERHADPDLHLGLLTEHELTRVLQMLDTIQDKLGIVVHANSELADLEMETKPEDVLAEIHPLPAIESSNR